MKDAIGNDPLGKLKSVRSTFIHPKIIDKLHYQTASNQNASPSETDTAKSKVTFTQEESIAVPVVAATPKIVSKTVVTTPAPEVQVEQTLPNKPTQPESEVASQPSATTFSVFSYIPSYLTGANHTDEDTDSKKATIELNAADLAAVQAYLKQKEPIIKLFPERLVSGTKNILAFLL